MGDSSLSNGWKYYSLGPIRALPELGALGALESAHRLGKPEHDGALLDEEAARLIGSIWWN